MVACFLVVPTGVDRRWLRRSVFDAKPGCPLDLGKHSSHGAWVEIERAPALAEIPDVPPHQRTDPRWPTHCRCGYAFQRDDDADLFRVEVYRRADTGEEVTIRDRRPGMMWLTPWYFDPTDPIDVANRGKDGFLSRLYWDQWSTRRAPLSIVCPDGSEWCPDQVSSNGPGWTVTGELPRITCSPSIVVKGYHGFLKDGVFTPDLDAGRPVIAPSAWDPTA